MSQYPETGPSKRVVRELQRLRDGACFKIEVTGHYLSVRMEDGQLVGVRHRGERVVVGPSEKDEEFVEQMMGWKGYEEVPRDQPPFDVSREPSKDETEPTAQTHLGVATDGGVTDSPSGTEGKPDQ